MNEFRAESWMLFWCLAFIFIEMQNGWNKKADCLLTIGPFNTNRTLLHNQFVSASMYVDNLQLRIGF